MERRAFLKALAAAAVTAAMPGRLRARPRGRKPNIICILADDLGYGELCCYGQKKIKTPHIDRLAAEGMRFTRHYSGSPVCAPSRCVLMTGLHSGHACIRNNSPWARKKNPHGEGQEPLPADTKTLAKLLKREGYATACIGKWGLGGPGTGGEPGRQGFDLFFGYLCQAQAHNYYPDHLWRNGEKVGLDNPPFSAHQKLEEEPESYARFRGKEYAPDLMADEALSFIRRNRKRPFFLYYPSTVPHAALQVPEDSLKAYEGQWEEKPYLGKAGYLPHPRPRAAYAAMISRMDRDVGRIMALLRELDLEEETIVLFSSDNGPTYNGGTDAKFFESAGPLRGLKGSVYEGGIRVPMIVRWTGRIEAGSTTDHVSGFQDVLPTCMDMAGAKTPAGLDGVSFAPTLLNEDGQAGHEYLYWELGLQQALRQGGWKLIRRWKKNGEAGLELFDLEKDPAETTNLCDARPKLRDRLLALINRARVPSDVFPAVYD